MGDLRSLLSEPARIRTLTQRIRAKIPAYDVDDVVQSTLADALASAAPPCDEPALDRWLIGIARHNVADYYRSHRRREVGDGDLDRHGSSTDGHSESARDLLHWVNGELAADSEAPRTLEWMMREADGDRLESIAAENNISAPAVRQRVSRLRRYLKERWALQLAAAITLVLAVGVYAYEKRQPTIQPEPTARVASPALAAQKLRQSALADCRSEHWQTCLEQLDRAKNLDPAGDNTSAIVEARADIARTLRAPAPSSSAPEERLAPAGDSAKTLQPLPTTPVPLPSQSMKAKRGSTQSTLNVAKQKPNHVPLDSNSSNSNTRPTLSIGESKSKPSAQSALPASIDSAVSQASVQSASSVQSNFASKPSKKTSGKMSSFSDFDSESK